MHTLIWFSVCKQSGINPKKKRRTNLHIRKRARAALHKNMNKSKRNLCCVCSGHGEHDIFSRIPVNVHSNPSEFRFWRETIAEYIADISGIYVSWCFFFLFLIFTIVFILHLKQITKDEKNYPNKICTICITYLKHAITFRRQVINNDRCMRQQFYSNNEPYNIKELMQCDLNTGAAAVATGDALWNDINLAPESETFDHLKMEIEQAFGGECDDSDDDESDENPGTSTTLFNYKEKSFTEDDITDFVSKSVLITIPDEMRERKCDACKQRFMLKESFDLHLKDCIELKLNKFIMEGYQLLSMRKSRALSANEFNRRMIFALKKMVKSLTSCYKEVSDGPSAAAAAAAINTDDKAIKKNNNIFDASVDNAYCIKKSFNTDAEPTTELSSIRLPKLLSTLEGKPNVSIQKNHLLESGQRGYSVMESTANLENPSNAMMPVTNFKPIGSSNGDIDFNQQILGATDSRIIKPMTRIKRRHPSELNTVIAQCSQCIQSFSSLQDFEDHIRTNHNSRTSSLTNVSRINYDVDFIFSLLELISTNFLFFHVLSDSRTIAKHI